MIYHVYILQNANGKLYIGQTCDIEKRMDQHNISGRGYTSKHRPWKLMHKESFLTRGEAMLRERYLKIGVGRDWIKEKILGD